MDEISALGEIDLKAVAGGFGLYVHIPFCTTRCDYCAFATWTDRENMIDDYVKLLCSEIYRARREEYWRNPETVFLGGGTPSLLNVDQVEMILEAAQPSSSAEITIECNPESTTSHFVRGIARLGVNRISLGVQSRKEHVLHGLGRTSHDGALERALDALCSAGIANYNVDLIYGGAGESTQDFVESLVEVLSFERPPTHISAYALTVEAGTPLAKSQDRHPDDDLQAERYEIAQTLLHEYGYGWYEISNWAQQGFACRHNLSCWLGGEYLGVGCAAHSHVAGERSANAFSIDRYMELIGQGKSARAKCERLIGREHNQELLELALRTVVGVPISCIDESVFNDGLMERAGEQAVLTLRGRLLANEVAMRIEAPLEESLR